MSISTRRVTATQVSNRRSIGGIATRFGVTVLATVTLLAAPGTSEAASSDGATSYCMGESAVSEWWKPVRSPSQIIVNFPTRLATGQTWVRYHVSNSNGQGFATPWYWVTNYGLPGLYGQAYSSGTKYWTRGERLGRLGALRLDRHRTGGLLAAGRAGKVRADSRRLVPADLRAGEQHPLLTWRVGTTSSRRMQSVRTSDTAPVAGSFRNRWTGPAAERSLLGSAVARR